jgi:phosphopantothenoylcysteine decarboxylase/phosphopantothenate--cysteine ligase
MGHALAAEAVARGARVVLVTASFLPAPAGCETVRVATAAEMLAAVLEHLPRATMVLKAAAVADFRPAVVAAGKLRRGGGLKLQLEPTEDILREVVARRARGTLVIGFAAETEDVLGNGRAKLARKGVDALVVNNVFGPESAFDSDENGGWFLTPGESVALPRTSKRRMAGRIFDLGVQMRTAPVSVD